MDSLETLIGGTSIVILIILLVLALAFYFIPTIVAHIRGHLNFVPILLVNIFFGWAFIGWVVALIWACSSHTRRNQA